MRTPEQIKKYIQECAIRFNKSTPNQKKVLAAVLDKALGDKTKRYEVCQFLTGAASTADMQGAEAGALLHWLNVSRFEDVPTDAVRAEINACHTAALKAKGQLEMEGVA